MPQFFIREGDITGDCAVIRGDDCHHLVHVRRAKAGDLLRLRFADGRGYTGRISSINAAEISLTLIDEITTEEEPVDISLYMALIKGGNFEFVLQKAVEIGVNRIIPVITSRTVPDLSGKKDQKLERWNRIITGAAKQCFRSSIPVVEYPSSFSDVIKNDSAVIKLIAHPGAVTELRDFLSSSGRPSSVSLLVGPEGGFSDTEILSASDAGWIAVNFGSTHLRAETAAVILPSLVIYQWS